MGSCKNTRVDKPKTHKLSGHRFQLPAGYCAPTSIIGTGSYGVVCKCVEDKTHIAIAVKKIALGDSLDELRPVLHELSALRLLAGHPNIVRATSVFVEGATPENMGAVYIAMHASDTDLSRIIRSVQPLDAGHIQSFMHQLLSGLAYMHSAGIMHRDIKPANLLVNANCELRLADLGLARTYPDTDGATMTHYMVTRWYRAPELVGSVHAYGPGVDVWSAGCILAELLLRRPLFQHAKDQAGLLRDIVQFTGQPSPDTLDTYSYKMRAFVRGVEECERKSLTGRFPGNTAHAELLGRLVCIDPARRISAAQATRSEYLENFHDDASDRENAAPAAVEHAALSPACETIAALHQLVWDEVHQPPASGIARPITAVVAPLAERVVAPPSPLAERVVKPPSPLAEPLTFKNTSLLWSTPMPPPAPAVPFSSCTAEITSMS